MPGCMPIMGSARLTEPLGPDLTTMAPGAGALDGMMRLCGSGC